jgi:hypothetical protein
MTLSVIAHYGVDLMSELTSSECATLTCQPARNPSSMCSSLHRLSELGCSLHP